MITIPMTKYTLTIHDEERCDVAYDESAKRIAQVLGIYYIRENGRKKLELHKRDRDFVLATLVRKGYRICLI